MHPSSERQALMGAPATGRAKPTERDHWFYSGLKMAGAAVSVAAGVISITLLFMAIFASNMDDNPVLITNTFNIEQGVVDALSWPILPTPWSGAPMRAQPIGGNLNHYYECLYTSQAGNAVCSNTTVEAYSACLDANFAAQLGQCNVSASVYKGQYPTQTQYGQCIAKAFALDQRAYGAFSMCLQSELWPLFANPQNVNTALFLGSFNWLLLSVLGYTIFVVFAVYTFWPRDFDEPHYMEYEKAVPAFNRMGVVWVWMPLALSVIVTIAALLVAFRTGSTGFGQDRVYPTTISTNALVVIGSIALFVYFVAETLDFRKVIMPNGRTGAEAGMQAYVQAPIQHAMGGYPSLAARVKIQDKDNAVAAYTPTLMSNWSYAYLSDALFFLGVVGATLQVDTSDAYNIFWGVLLYRWIHLAVTDLVREAYIPEVNETGPESAPANADLVYAGAQIGIRNIFMGPSFKPNGYDQDAAEYTKGATRFQDVRDRETQYQVQALAAHLAAVVTLVNLSATVLNANKLYCEYTVVILALVLGFIVPEALRFAYHLKMVMYPGYHGYHALNVAMLYQFLWLWDLGVRLIVICMLYWGATSMPGTRPFLTDSNANLTLALKYLAI